MDNFEDKKMICKECQKEFVFTKGEQAFYQLKGFTHQPKRCRECRLKRKDMKEKQQERKMK